MRPSAAAVSGHRELQVAGGGQPGVEAVHADAGAGGLRSTRSRMGTRPPCSRTGRGTDMEDQTAKFRRCQRATSRQGSSLVE
eukprot:3143608-Pyramimonas_sp.AAC.1